MRTGRSENRDEYVRRHRSEALLRMCWRKLLGRLQRSVPSARLRRVFASWMGVKFPQSLSPSSRNPPFIGLEVWIDDTFPEMVTIHEGSVVALRVTIMAHDDATRSVSETSIGPGAYIGVGSIILPGVQIGEKAVIGAGAVVTSDVPAGETWAGVPARRIDSQK